MSTSLSTITTTTAYYGPPTLPLTGTVSGASSAFDPQWDTIGGQPWQPSTQPPLIGGDSHALPGYWPRPMVGRIVLGPYTPSPAAQPAIYQPDVDWRIAYEQYRLRVEQLQTAPERPKRRRRKGVKKSTYVEPTGRRIAL